MACGGPATPDVADASAPYKYREEHDRNGTGKFYLGREIARTTGPETATWQERPTREREQRPDLLIDNLDLEPDDVVADVGAGTGYHSFRIATHVPKGRVIAVEIDPEWLRLIQQKAERLGVRNVETRLGTEMDPGLEPSSVDLVLMVDVYHELLYPVEMMREIRRALRPGGRVVLVEYRLEDPDVRVMRVHKMSEAQARRELEAAGLVWVRNVDVLPQQHLLVFRNEGPSGAMEDRDPGAR
ncbi:MAG: class I SAM-dependent methyltransferase [Myxococcota bacterium]